VNAWNTVKEDAKDTCNDVTHTAEQGSQEEAVLHEEAEVSPADTSNTIEEDLSSVFNDLKDCISQDTIGQLQAGLQKFYSC